MEEIQKAINFVLSHDGDWNLHGGDVRVLPGD